VNPLLRAVLDNPGDDLPRQIYADWLAENGQEERAEFIRLSIATHGKTHHPFCRDGCCCDCGQDYSRLENLWYSPAKGFTVPVTSKNVMYTIGDYIDGSYHLQCKVRRGFISELRGPLDSLLEHGPAIVAEHPVERVTVTDIEMLGGVMRLPHGTQFITEMPGASTDQYIEAYQAAVLAEIRRRAKEHHAQQQTGQ
jgi:uncharacterized protein (TIGR02996 family)